MNPQALIDAADALLVDLDGTLVDSTAPVRRAWAAFAARHGLDPEHVHHFAQGRPSRESVRLLTPDADLAAEADALERAEVGDTDGMTARPGARDLLSGGRRLAIVTSCSSPLAAVRLRAALRTTHADDGLHEADAIVDDLSGLLNGDGTGRAPSSPGRATRTRRPR